MTSIKDLERLMDARALCMSGEAREIREAAGLSLNDVSRVLGCDYSAIGRWERGERVPRGAMALKYAALLERLCSR